MSRRRSSPLFRNLTAPGAMFSRIAARRKGSHRRPDRANSTRRLALEMLEDRLCLDSSSRFSEYLLPTSSGDYGGITEGPDDALWFTRGIGNKIGRIDPTSHQITEFPLPTQDSWPNGITAGPDDALWFTEDEGNKIGRIDPISHQITEFPLPDSSYTDPSSIVEGPDGALWFTAIQAVDSRTAIGRIDPTTHQITEFPLPTQDTDSEGITVGPDGALWFTEYSSNKIGRIDPTTHQITEFPLPTQDTDSEGITVGPDGALWFTEYSSNKIGRIDPASGHISEYSVPTQNSYPGGITAGPDDALWFTEIGANKIGRIETNGKPVAQADAFSTLEDEELEGNVLANDTDEDDDTLTAIRIEGQGPRNGSVTLNSDGTFTYTPEENFQGFDSFAYQAYDGPKFKAKYSDVVTVTIKVGDGVPKPSPSSGDICPDTPGNKSPIAPDRLTMNLTNTPSALSVAPVRYADGVVKLDTTDLESDGFGGPWAQSRSWTNGAGYAARSNNGNGMVDIDQPYLIQVSGDDTIAVVTSGTNALYFDRVNGAYVARFDGKETLAADLGTGEFVLTDTAGDVLRFYGFDPALPFDQRGQLKNRVDPAGNVTDLSQRNPDGTLAVARRSNTTGETTVTESFVYTYIPSGINQGLLESVTLQRQVNGGTPAAVRSVVYDYYDGIGAYGNLGDLKTATIRDGDTNGNVIDVDYYRYYTPGEAGGYVHGLKYFFSPASYARLVAVVGDPAAAGDALVAPYADNYFEYDAQHRATKEIAQGFGCSVCTSGLGEFAYSFTESTNPDGPNSWRVRTVEGLPDGNENIVYTNSDGQVMLRDFHEVATGRHWIEFWEYDASNRVVLHALPSAITSSDGIYGYNDIYADLLHDVNGNYDFLADDAGLIETTTYDAVGYPSRVALRHGETGADVPQHSYTYTTQAGGGASVVEIASETVYRNDDGTGAEITNYTYTWYAGTNRMASMTVTHPVVVAGQDGPGTADVETVVYDRDGRVSWTRDGDGFLTYTAYDEATGAVIATIDDVDTSRTADFSGLPAGWATPPTGGGRHLVTRYEVDPLGRETKRTDPNGNVTYTVYDDDAHEVRVYAGWDPNTNRPTGPTVVVREDRAGSYTETLTMAAAPDVGLDGRPTGAEAIGDLQSLTRDFTNRGGQVIESDAYFNLTGLTYSTAANLGAEGVNFYSTRYAYTQRGWLNQVESPTGTITRTVYDGLGRVVSTWVGTDDTGATNSSPAGTGGPNNMVEVADYQYDGGGVGDGNLTRTTLLPGGGADPRVTRSFYDWRDRLVATKGGVQATEAADTQRPITYLTYDNLGAVTATDLYDGDGVTLGSDADGDGVPDPPDAARLRAHATAEYDDQGRVFASHTFSVDPATGAVSTDSLTTRFWYDHRGLLIAQASPGGLVEKMAYDGAGRVTVQHSTDGGGDAAWADAGDVVGDAVLEQVETAYDANGNPILTTTRQRFHDETATGALGDPATGPRARVSYVASYYDKLDRPTVVVDLGTNGGAVYTRPADVPARSDTALVTSFTYDAAGRLETTTDPRGIVTRTTYDALGRATETIDAYTDGIPTDSSNQVVDYTYDAAGHVLSVSVLLPGGGTQTTQHVYGVTVAGGSGVDSNDLLAEVRHPDKATGAASPDEAETSTYNALGERITATDRNGTTHAYAYDVLGRQTSDAVTTLGAGVDGSVRRLATAYDSAGRAYLFTSYDAASGGNVVNQVERTYNGLGQLTAEYQAHAGVVDTATTPAVRYAYSEMAGGANHSRLVAQTYPDGRVLHYDYAPGLDDAISRLGALADDDGSGGIGTLLETYDYLGLNTIVRRGHPEPGVDLTYIQQAGDPNAQTDGGDPYTGLDRFGRVIDQNWVDTATGTATDRFQYGYDRGGNRLYQADLVDAALSALYHANSAQAGDDNAAYDPLGRLTGFARGVLSASGNNGASLDTVSTAEQSQSWQLDALGNWAGVASDGTTTTRDFNAQNQTTGVSGGSTPTYDGNGNTTGDDGRAFTYDAWNRLVAAADPTTATELARYAYDALGRRVQEAEGPTGSATSGGGSTPSYYDGSVGDGLRATYFDNQDFTGPSLTRVDPGVDLDWGAGSPDPAIGPDTFSARWEGQVLAQYTETYTFYTQLDDGVRLWVDGQLLIDQWHGSAEVEYSGTIALQAGHRYALRLEYFENTGDAVVHLLWSSASTPKDIIPASQLFSLLGDGLRATYFDDLDLTGTSTSRVDPGVDFDWGTGSPDPAIGPDTFSTRWEGQVVPQYTETYTFYTQTDDGVRLWVDGQLLIDQWHDGGVTEYSGTIALEAGHRYALRLEYYENGGGASERLLWSSASTPKEVIPASQLVSDVTGDGLLSATYYDNNDFTGPSFTRLDPGVDFDWGAGSPDPSLGPDTFSIRWEGQVLAPFSETYTFYTRNDDGVRLWVDGQLLIDQWHGSSGTEYSGTIALQAGRRYALRLEYYEDSGQAKASLLWSSASTPKELIPASQLFSYATPQPAAATTIDLYYSPQWQVIEERQDGTAAADASRQYVWSAAYVDALVLRDDLAGGVPTQRLYAQQDANFDTTALIDTSGAVVERYTYTPYGEVTVRDAGGTPLAGNTSGFGWQYQFQGGRLDAVTGWYGFRHRDYIPGEGRWAEEDPLGFVAGDVNLYRYVRNQPNGAVDPSGLGPLSWIYTGLWNPPQNVWGAAMDAAGPAYTEAYNESATGATLVLDAASFAPGPVGWVAAGTNVALVSILNPNVGPYKGPLYAVPSPSGRPIIFGRPVPRGPLAQPAKLPRVNCPAPRAAAQTATPAKGGTYIIRDPATGQVMRTGRTNDLARRQLEHARDPALRNYEFEIAHRTDVYAEQRGLEQMLHETYKPPLNKIGGIDPNNPRLPEYREAAQQFLQGQRGGP